MQRVPSAPRTHWVETVEGQGLIYHHTHGGLYWNETARYTFTAREVDELETATNELQRLCLEAGQHVIDTRRFRDYGIPDAAAEAIKWAWEHEPPAIYGRFDLAYDGVQPTKLLEYNADTPTGLLEAAVVQWYWLKDSFGSSDQFNSIHERLRGEVARVEGLHDRPAVLRRGGGHPGRRPDDRHVSPRDGQRGRADDGAASHEGHRMGPRSRGVR